MASTLAILTSLLLIPLWQQPDQVLAFNDGNIESVLSPIFSYPDALFRIWDDQTFFGAGQAGTGVALWSLMETALGAHHYRRWGSWLAIWWTGLCAYWCLRQLGRRRGPALVGAVFFSLCGWTTTFALNGLLNRSLTLGLGLLVVGVMARNRARGDGWLGYLVAGGLLGLAVTQTPDVGAFFALALAGYLLLGEPFPKSGAGWRRRFLGLVLVVIASIGTSWQTVSKMASTQVAGAGPATAGAPDGHWKWATQWSLPKGETWSLVIPDFHGSSTRSEEHPYWGRMGRWPDWQSPRQGPANFRLHGYAFGVVSTFLALLAACTLLRRRDPERRQVAVWSVCFLVALFLSWGRFFFAYRLFYALPFMDSIRSPEKWLGPATLFFGLLLALGAERLGDWLRRDDDLLWRIGTGYWLGIGLLTLWLLQGGSANLLRQRLQELGRGDHFAAAWQHSQSVAWTAIVVAITLILGLRVLAPWMRRRPFLVYLIVGGLMSFELLTAASRFVVVRDYRPALEDNQLSRTLDEALAHGRLKLQPPRLPKLNQWRLTQLVARGYPLYDPVSVSRLDARYRSLFEALDNRPLDLWRLGAVRFFLTTPQVTTELQALSEHFVRLARRPAGEWESREGEAASQGPTIDLLELTNALPPVRLISSWAVLPDDEQGDALALQQLAKPSHPYDRITLIQGRESPPQQVSTEPFRGEVNVTLRSPARWLLETDAERDSLLVRASRFDPRWVARLDGTEVPLLRANYLFQAVAIPAGEHRLELSFEPSTVGTWIAVSGRLLLLGLTVLWWRRVGSAAG